MIKLKDVSFKYHNANRGMLKNINLNIADGQCILLCGESGCGKTTIVRLINGLIPHFFEGEISGSVEVEDMDIAISSLEKISEKVGSVFQNPRSQFFCTDTTSEIAFGPENLGLPEARVIECINKAVKLIEVEALLDRNIFKLSGGEKQKIACASISAVEPKVIVLDEPSSNLDLEAIEMLSRAIAIWKVEGKTIVIAEHRLNWLDSLADRVIYLKEGEIQREFSGKEFFALEDEELNKMGLRSNSLGINYLKSPLGFHEIKENNKIHDYIKLKNFQFTYSKNKQGIALGDVDIPRNSIVAIVGQNGAGKSTFSHCLCGVKKGFRGQVEIEDKIYKKKELIELCFMVMQDVNHQLFTESVMEELMLDFKEDNENLAEKVLTNMDLLSHKNDHPMSLSGGEKQRLAICLAYLSDRPILVFDEPTSGLDYRRMQSTAALIKDLSKEKTIFIVTHDMELIDKCCTHILHIENGRLN